MDEHDRKLCHRDRGGGGGVVMDDTFDVIARMINDRGNL